MFRWTNPNLPWLFLLFAPYILPIARQDDEPSQGALLATLRRVCTPKPGSGRLEVGTEIYKQWAQGGAPRKALMDVLVSCKGDKDFSFSNLTW